MGISSLTGSRSSWTSVVNKATNSIFSALGCPSLRSLGLSVGNIIKIFKNNSEDVSTELKDIALQTSTYNKIIPEVFGQVRLAGNIIWCSEIKKTSVYHPQKTTKSGSQSAYTEYFVRCSFAVAICKGTVDEIKNIYADDEPLNLATYNIKIYKGNDTQIADPTMQSYLGADIPAFRGLCYVVFNDFPMEEFNNRIPNFTFDVVRKKEIQEANDMENLVSAITLIPGSGEFVYDTKVQKKFNGNWLWGKFYETSKATLLNKHTANEETDAIVSLNDLCNTFSNLEWISLVVCWFCDNLNSDDATIFPACENNSSNTSPDTWSVAGKTRLTAKLVGLDEDGNIRYGGTPSDDCVLRYAQEIKKRGLKLCLYPMLMMDVDKKPWRGHMTGSASEMHNFFTKEDGYNHFVKHYTELLKNEIDAVIIGSEMKGLTSVYNKETKTYPAVDEFCNLASEIKKIVKKNTKLVYAADWSEYHHDALGNYNLDDLWTCKNIDYIGIDAYFPLTDKSNTTYDIEEIKNGWRSGEGWNFYYSDNERTVKADLSPEYAWKNVEYFWSHEHYNADGTKTSWIPKSKKIWFTEYGFPSVDCCTNEPNVFYSPGSYDSAFPRHSRGMVDFKAQRVAITASELAWKDSECVEEMFLYTWDARPYPYFPNLKDVWADSACWKYGHFMNGKGGTATLANIINYLCRRVGLKESEFDTSLLGNDILDGYILNDKKSILNHLKILATAYNFDAFMDGNTIYFKSLKDTQNHVIDYENLILDNQSNDVMFKLETQGDINIPSSVELVYIDTSKDYTTSTAIARDNSRDDNACGFSVSIPMNVSQAQEIAWRILSNLSNQGTNYVLNLPISFLYISPLDTITIVYNEKQHIIRVKNIKIIDAVTLQITGNSIVANENILTNLEYINEDISAGSQTKSVSHLASTYFDCFELYNIYNDIANNEITLHCAVYSEDENWSGATLYYSIDEEQNYQVLKYVNTETSVGKLLSISQQSKLSANFIDINTEIIFSLFNEDGKLQSLTDDDFLQMKYKILIGDEVISFRDVDMLEPNVFKISHLLRGRCNTENFISSHQIGERVILLDNDLISIDIPSTQKGKNIYLKAISNGDSLMNVEAIKITPQARSIYDFDVKNLQKTMLKNGDILLSFSARKNYKINNAHDVVITNNLMLKIMNKQGNILRKEQLSNTNRFVYSVDNQIIDFGKRINVSDFDYTVDNLIII